MNTQQEYYNSIKENGLTNTWNTILDKYFPNEYFAEDKLGGLYEEGLAFDNKISKKEMGKYYTPDDVADIMAKKLLSLPGDNICDICCGTGNLILKVLENYSKEEAIQKLLNGNIYLYDIDENAVHIAKAIIKNRYGQECANHVNIIIKDLITNDLELPDNSKIISNPPYGTNHNLTCPCAKETNEMYVEFFEKFLFSKSPFVIITPHSFMGGDNFKKLRIEMSDFGGEIFSFDNVPGNIFKGKKFGIFNSNEANSTRAAISIINPEVKGYKVSPFIRFLTAEREKILNISKLNSLLPNNRQIPSNGEILYRIDKFAEKMTNDWLNHSRTFNDLLSDLETKYKLNVPNSCRYYLSGTVKDLNRSGKYVFYFKDKDSFYLGYAFLNSSFSYYYQRICNGGITFPIGLLKQMPIFGINNKELESQCNKMIENESQYITIKMNAGQPQENVKFLNEDREKLNKLLLKQLKEECSDLLKAHNNSILSAL